jgi:DNA-binding GntR family transcriptional regulator
VESIPGFDDPRIYEQMCRAIIERQLPPGTKLGEEALCAAFNTSRPRIRQVLQTLAHEHLVELRLNRGAFVAQPSVREAREIFEARRVIESAVVEAVMAVATKAQIRELQAFVRKEDEAQLNKDRPAAIRLSGELHLRLAEMSGNTVLARVLRQLISRTSLIIAMYESPGASGCNAEHHDKLVSLIGSGDAKRAVAFMREHLSAIEGSLALDETPVQAVDLRRIFARMDGD